MTVSLLDANVLIALADQDHLFAKEARDWFKTTGASGFATCPLTENALVRIMANKSYPSGARPVGLLLEILREYRKLPGHRFWPDDISLCDLELFSPEMLQRSADVTDSYLLALAVRNNGRLATFDRKLTGATVIGGPQAIVYI